MNLTRLGSITLGITAALCVGLASFTSLATETWQLQDLRYSFTTRAHKALNLIAGRGNDWMVSDGANLWMVNTKGETTDYTDKARLHGEVSAIGSDGSSYLIGWNQSNTITFSHVSADGVWTDPPAPRLNNRIVRSVAGSSQRYAILSEDRFSASASLPKTWNITLWQTGANSAETPTLPSGASGFVPGCITDANGGTICASNVAFLPLNGDWYLLAGEAETRTRDGLASQTAKAHMWRWKNNGFEAVGTFPEARYVSAAWAGNGELLIATSNAVTNPFAADTYWTFNGNTFRKYQTGPLAAGLLSVDTRSIQAAWNGNGWTLTAGKTLVRFEQRTFSVEGILRDTPLALSGSTNGSTLLIGQKSDFEGAANDIEPSAILLAKSIAVNDTSSLIHPRDIPHPNSITAFHMGSTPEPAIISNGSAFTFRASAKDMDGIERLQILVHGVPVKTCMSSSCSYTQTFWTRNATTTEVLFAARAYDRIGAVSQSQEYRLTILETPVYSTPSAPTTDLGRMPAGLAWGHDPIADISFTTWLSPTSTSFAANEIKTYSVAVTHPDAIKAIEIWVNGRLERTCHDDQETDIAFCSVPVLGNNFPSGAEVYMNARIVRNDQRETWTPGTRVQR